MTAGGQSSSAGGGDPQVRAADGFKCRIMKLTPREPASWSGMGWRRSPARCLRQVSTIMAPPHIPTFLLPEEGRHRCTTLPGNAYEPGPSTSHARYGSGSTIFFPQLTSWSQITPHKYHSASAPALRMESMPAAPPRFPDQVRWPEGWSHCTSALDPRGRFRRLHMP